jgi:Rad/Gem-related GTP binding protein 1
MNRNELPDAYVVVYSVIDKSSFQRIEDEMARLQNWEALRARALIVVGNKIDLVRSRAVSTQGIINKTTAVKMRALVHVDVSHSIVYYY